MEMCYKEVMDFYEFSGIKRFWINFLDFTIRLFILK